MVLQVMLGAPWLPVSELVLNDKNAIHGCTQ